MPLNFLYYLWDQLSFMHHAPGLGHGEPDGDQPEEGVGGAPSGCERRRLRRQVYRLCKRGQDHQGWLEDQMTTFANYLF